MLIKSFTTNQELVTPEEPDMAAIRKYALKQDLQPSDVWCGALKVCNTKVDRSGERFTKAYLQRFAETLPGKAILGGHDYGSRPLGRLYAAEVLPDGADHYLKGYWYTAADSPVVREVELGIAKDCSIGFNAGRRTCDLDGKAWNPFADDEFCGHWPLQDYEGKTCTLTYCDSEAHKAEGMEVSLVWHGCQYDAEAVAKSLLIDWKNGAVSPEDMRRRLMPSVRGANGMDLTQAMAEIERLKGLPLADAERKALQEQITALKAKEPLADDGAAYRQHLQAEMKRMATSLDSRTKSDVETKYVDRLLERMPDASAEDLKAFMEPLQQRFDVAFAQGDGHGNGPGDPDDKDKTKKKSSRFGRWAEGW